MMQDEDYGSDTSDEDFIPDGVVESDDDPVSGDDEEHEEGDGGSSASGKKRKRKKGKTSPVPVPPEEEVNEEDKKKKADDIWADFLADVEEESAPPPKPKPKSSSWGALIGNKKTKPEVVTSKPKVPVSSTKSEKKEEKSNTVKITQVYEFAGEEVRVEKEVHADSDEAKTAAAAAAAAEESPKAEGISTNPGLGGIKRGGGLSGIVGLLDSKKQKLSTLEKTKLDWNRFKTDEGIDEELEKHKKSKDGYLEKQAFLERADVRQFEIERAMRMSKRSNR